MAGPSAGDRLTAHTHKRGQVIISQRGKLDSAHRVLLHEVALCARLQPASHAPSQAGGAAWLDDEALVDECARCFRATGRPSKSGLQAPVAAALTALGARFTEVSALPC